MIDETVQPVGYYHFSAVLPFVQLSPRLVLESYKY